VVPLAALGIIVIGSLTLLAQATEMQRTVVFQILTTSLMALLFGFVTALVVMLLLLRNKRYASGALGSMEARLRRGHSFRGRWPNFMHRVIIEERDEVFADVALQCVGLEQNELLFSRALLRVPPEAGISAFLHQPARVQRTLIPLLGRAGLVVCIVGLQHVAGIAARLQAHPGVQEIGQ